MFSHTSQSPLQLTIAYLKDQKGRLAAALGWRTLFILIPMQLPIITGAVVDGLSGEEASFYGITLPASNPLYVLQIASIGLVIIALLYGTSSYMHGVSRARLSRNFVASLRKRTFRKMSALSLNQHHEHGAGELLERALRDTASMRLFLYRVFIQSVTNVLRVIYPIVMMLIIDVRLALIVLTILPTQYIFTRFLQKKLHTATQTRRQTQSELTEVVKEGLDGIETIKSLHAEKQFVHFMQKTATQLEEDEMTTSRITAGISGTVWMMTSIGVAIAWWLGGKAVMSGEMTVGTLVMFLGFVTLAYRPFRQFTTMLNTYKRGIVGLERIHKLLSTTNEIKEEENASTLSITAGRISLCNVSFSYDEAPVLEEVSMEIAPRQLTAIVGRSGSGKSSILRLVSRLYDPKEGYVLIDGQPIHQMTLGSVRSNIAVVPQKPMLFTGTLLDNIRIAKPDATIEEVYRVCEEAFLTSVIDRLEHGLHTPIGRGGSDLSGGELQRLSIARALVTQPAILLLDEPTSGLDAESESAIVNTLLRLRGKVTVIVVAHRIETVRRADQIYVMDAGRLVGKGTHRSLSKSSTAYQDILGMPHQNHRPSGKRMTLVAV